MITTRKRKAQKLLIFHRGNRYMHTAVRIIAPSSGFVLDMSTTCHRRTSRHQRTCLRQIR